MRTRAVVYDPPALVECDCNCGCEPDGDWHYDGAGCQCVNQGCDCVVDEPGKPVMLSIPD